MRSARAALPATVNPYRTHSIALGARRSRLLRTRSLLRFAVVIFGAGAFAAGFAVGRRPAEPPPDMPASAACAPAPAPEAADTETTTTQEEAWSAYAITPAQAKATIAGRAREVLRVIGRRDMRLLAGFVDVDDGLRFGEIGAPTSLLLSAVDLARCLEDTTERASSNGDPVKCGDLWREHVLGADFPRASQVDYNLPSAGGQPASMLDADARAEEDPTLRDHRDHIVVQIVVRRPSLDRETDSHCGSEERGWSTLRLVWSPHGEQWKLAGIFWKEWWT